MHATGQYQQTQNKQIKWTYANAPLSDSQSCLQKIARNNSRKDLNMENVLSNIYFNYPNCSSLNNTLISVRKKRVK